jgi:predicted pyridoxine 5'-phosphate oxidase superfamily flavin-nucleotide-binding protein
LGTTERAEKFYAEQVLDYLTPTMIDFVRRQDMAFIATSDGDGHCDAGFRAGHPGFLHVMDERTLAYPEYRGNGVMASLGNMLENPRVGLLLIDFVRDLIGLHINGTARLVEDHVLREAVDDLPVGTRKRVESWVVISVQEAYIQCRKHIPRMVPAPVERAWGTDDPAAKGGDYFGAKDAPRPLPLR